MVALGINGVLGRMGLTILKVASEDKEVKVVNVVEHPENPNIGKSLKEITGFNIDLTITDSFLKGKRPEVIVDFTTPEATISAIDFALKENIPVVIGTTGFDEEKLEKIKQAGKKIPIVFSPNMSIGVNLLFKLVEIVSKTLGNDFDVEIVEVHHRFKKDAPSGTALKLAEIIANSLNRNLSESMITGRQGIIGERSKKEIGIMSIRAGDVVGEHTVIFGGLGERIELTHRAHSRETFARGAIRAAKWIVDKEPGLYSMFDVLGL